MPSKTVRHFPEIRARRLERPDSAPTRIENLLPQRQQEAFRKIATVFAMPKSGTAIFSEGQDAEFVYAVAEGIVRLCRHTDGGRRQVLSFMLPGDLFGLPDAGVYVNSADSACPGFLYRVPWIQLHELMAREPALQRSLLVRVAYDLRETQRRIMTLGQQNSYQRLASFLLDFVQHPAFFDGAKGILNLPLTRFDIADYLGTTPETVARGFARLENEGYVRRLTARTVKICDVGGLASVQQRRRRSLKAC